MFFKKFPYGNFIHEIYQLAAWEACSWRMRKAGVAKCCLELNLSLIMRVNEYIGLIWSSNTWDRAKSSEKERKYITVENIWRAIHQSIIDHSSEHGFFLYMLLVNLVAAVDLLNKQTELLRIPRKEKRKGKKKEAKARCIRFQLVCRCSCGTSLRCFVESDY